MIVPKKSASGIDEALARKYAATNARGGLRHALAELKFAETKLAAVKFGVDPVLKNTRAAIDRAAKALAQLELLMPNILAAAGEAE